MKLSTFYATKATLTFLMRRTCRFSSWNIQLIPIQKTPLLFKSLSPMWWMPFNHEFCWMTRWISSQTSWSWWTILRHLSHYWVLWQTWSIFCCEGKSASEARPIPFESNLNALSKDQGPQTICHWLHLEVHCGKMCKEVCSEQSVITFCPASSWYRYLCEKHHANLLVPQSCFCQAWLHKCFQQFIALYCI